MHGLIYTFVACYENALVHFRFDLKIFVLKANKLPAVFDLSKIDFLDSSGLGALVQLAKQCTDAKRPFMSVGTSRVKQTVKLVRLEEFLHMVEDLPTALSQLKA